MYSPPYQRSEPSAPATEDIQVPYIPQQNVELQVRLQMLERQNSSLTELLVSSEKRTTRFEESLKLEIEKNQLLTEKIKTMEESIKQKYQQKMRAFISRRVR